jgi:hypothetical protein
VAAVLPAVQCGGQTDHHPLPGYERADTALGTVLFGIGALGALLALSALLTATTIIPRIALAPAVTGLTVAIAVLAACAALIATRARPGPAAAPAPGSADRRTWTMPPIESLRPPAHSAWRTLGLVVLRCYLLAAITVLAVRVIQIALGAG